MLSIPPPDFRLLRASRRLAKTFSLSLSESANPNASMIYTPCEAGFFSEVYSKRLGIAVTPLQQQESAWIPLGLLARDFATHLQSLCGSTEEIDAIILSDKGFIHALKDTNDITNFLVVLSQKIKLLDAGTESFPRSEIFTPAQQKDPEGISRVAAVGDFSDYFRESTPTPLSNPRP